MRLPYLCPFCAAPCPERGDEQIFEWIPFHWDESAQVESCRAVCPECVQSGEIIPDPDQPGEFFRPVPLTVAR